MTMHSDSSWILILEKLGQHSVGWFLNVSTIQRSCSRSLLLTMFNFFVLSFQKIDLKKYLSELMTFFWVLFALHKKITLEHIGYR